MVELKVQSKTGKFATSVVVERWECGVGYLCNTQFFIAIHHQQAPAPWVKAIRLQSMLLGMGFRRMDLSERVEPRHGKGHRAT